LEWKTELTPNRGQRLLADYAEVRRKKSLRSRIKAKSGKLLVFRLERESGSDERSNGERLLAGYLLQGGAKACAAGLKRKTLQN